MQILLILSLVILAGGMPSNNSVTIENVNSNEKMEPNFIMESTEINGQLNFDKSNTTLKSLLAEEESFGQVLHSNESTGVLDQNLEGKSNVKSL